MDQLRLFPKEAPHTKLRFMAARPGLGMCMNKQPPQTCVPPIGNLPYRSVPIGIGTYGGPAEEQQAGPKPSFADPAVRSARLRSATCRCSLIAEFYLVDGGLRHRLPGFSSLGRLGVLP
jgi:hypothetical protein